MKVGTKSVLYGAHCFFIHPLWVLLAWCKLYGFPTDIRLWIAFFIHDLGYIGKPNMDGLEGESHVIWAARMMSYWFDQREIIEFSGGNNVLIIGWSDKKGYHTFPAGTWGQLCLFHSRFWAKRYHHPFSRLCVADKLALGLEPWWWYIPRAWLSGEIWEYFEARQGRNGSKYKGEPNSVFVNEQLNKGTFKGWYLGVSAYCREWAYAHQGGGPDLWTPDPNKQGS